MKVAKWGNSLAIRIPKDVAEALRLEEGSEVDLVPVESGLGLSTRMTREEALATIRRLARPLPADWKMTREEMHGV